MKKVHIIFCADYNFQVVQILPSKTLEEAWDEANEIFTEHPEIGECYDVISFDSMSDANSYILSQAMKNDKYTVTPKEEALPEETVYDEEKSWNVPVCRIGYGHHLMAVSARSESEAIEKALDEAGGEEFSESSSEYDTPDGAQLID